MQNQNQQPQMNINLKNTTSVETPNGGKIFQQGFILRKVSKFVVGGETDAVLPLAVMYDTETGKIVTDTLPKELHEEYTDDLI